MFKGVLKILKKGKKTPLSLKSDFLDRRISPRVMQSVPCSIYDHMHQEKMEDSLVRDIGFYGLCVDTDFPVSVADGFSIDFCIGEVMFEHVKAFVVWTARYGPHQRSGLAFESAIASKIRKALMKLFRDAET